MTFLWNHCTNWHFIAVKKGTFCLLTHEEKRKKKQKVQLHLWSLFLFWLKERKDDFSDFNADEWKEKRIIIYYSLDVSRCRRKTREKVIFYIFFLSFYLFPFFHVNCLNFSRVINKMTSQDAEKSTADPTLANENYLFNCNEVVSDDKKIKKHSRFMFNKLIWPKVKFKMLNVDVWSSFVRNFIY